MINFEGYYFVAAEKIECISTKIGDAAPKYGLFLNLTSGREVCHKLCRMCALRAAVLPGAPAERDDNLTAGGRSRRESGATSPVGALPIPA